MPNMAEVRDQQFLNEVSRNFIPDSVYYQCACYVYYDWHPRDNRKIDIIVCTRQGELMEFYQRNKIYSISISNAFELNQKETKKLDLDHPLNFKKLRILRNFKGELFYLVEFDRKLIIVSRKENLSIHKMFSHVNDYEVIDLKCTGEPVLKISHSISSEILLDSVTYISIDNNFEVVNDEPRIQTTLECTNKISSTLESKLNEAKYNLKINENALRTITSLSAEIQQNGNNNLQQMERLKPVVRFCNEKIIILLKIDNKFTDPMDKVHALIHNNGCNSISYTSKLFEKFSECPFYREIETQSVKKNSKAILATVILLKEFKFAVISKIEFCLVVAFQRHGQDYLQYCDDVHVSASDVMGKNYDLFNSNLDSKEMVLGLMASMNKTTLCLKQINFFNSNDNVWCTKKFCMHLEMEQISANLAVNKISPHHILFGMMIFFHALKPMDITFEIDVYARSTSQVLALIHLIYDKTPFSIIVTTPNIRVTPTCTDSLAAMSDEEDLSGMQLENFDSRMYASTLWEKTKITLNYFRDCYKKMNPGHNLDSVNQINEKIDIAAMGLDKFEEYRNKMLEISEIEVLQPDNMEII